MKNIKQLLWIPSLTLIFAGCCSGSGHAVAHSPVVTNHPAASRADPTLSEWQTYGEMLPPTGMSSSRVYATQPQPANYPAPHPDIIVDQNGASTDAVLADTIRRQIEFDRGLAPSLEHVVIVVSNGRVTLQGTVRSDLDSRVIVDNLRDIAGVAQITNEMKINPIID